MSFEKFIQNVGILKIKDKNVSKSKFGCSIAKRHNANLHIEMLDVRAEKKEILFS